MAFFFFDCPMKFPLLVDFWSTPVQFSPSVMSNSLQPHGLQHARPPCPSPTPGVYPNACPLSQWCHPTISSSVVPFSSLLPSIFPSITVFSSESALCIRWPKYWSFSFNISPSNEHSGLISFRILQDLLYPLKYTLSLCSFCLCPCEPGGLSVSSPC